jgi:cytoskeletal protein CcmA (bactofilin family)
VIKGRFLGKLIAEHSLTIHSTAEIKGSFKTARLVVPAANHFRWPETIKVVSAEIAGELVNNLHAEQSVVVKSTARFFGDIEARSLVVQEGAVIVGHLRIGERGGK